jgi:hypothetical protein
VGEDSVIRCTPLHLAARQGCPDVVAVLIARGADVDAKVVDGRTPLHEALGGVPPRIQAALVLLACGASPDGNDLGGELLEAWRACTHPVQVERRAVEAAVLSASSEMPATVARLIGDFVHLHARATGPGTKRTRQDTGGGAAGRSAKKLGRS